MTELLKQYKILMTNLNNNLKEITLLENELNLLNMKCVKAKFDFESVKDERDIIFYKAVDTVKNIVNIKFNDINKKRKILYTILFLVTEIVSILFGGINNIILITLINSIYYGFFYTIPILLVRSNPFSFVKLYENDIDVIALSINYMEIENKINVLKNNYDIISCEYNNVRNQYNKKSNTIKDIRNQIYRLRNEYLIQYYLQNDSININDKPLTRTKKYSDNKNREN